MSRIHSVLTVIGKDRPGIIAKVTEVLFRNGCNLEDMSMTRLERELAMMVIVRLEKKRKPAVEKALSALVKAQGLTFFWKDLKISETGTSRQSPNFSCLVTAIGKDRTGIVYEVSRLMARFGLNITDLNSRVLGKGASSLYAMMLEVEVPKNFSIKKLSKPLETLGRKLKIEVRMKPVERIEL